MTLTLTPDSTLPEVLHVSPVRHRDERGWFSEVYSDQAFAKAGLAVTFVQDNHSYSRSEGTLRGLHFQTPPHAQAKLVRCVRGRILDVIVDIRHGSPRFGQHTRAEISAAGGEQIFVPEGFAHGFCTLEPDCEVIYKVSAPYNAAADGGIAFDDPALGINWPYALERLVLSPRDTRHPVLAKLGACFKVSEGRETA
jgi:dTDP-4-dehydrorhamnose 3,5-epimerase